jgi:hypothetical protein
LPAADPLPSSAAALPVARTEKTHDRSEARLPLHLRGRLPAPPPERGAPAFLGDYGLKKDAKPVAMPPKRRDAGVVTGAAGHVRQDARRVAAAVDAGGEGKRTGACEQKPPPRQPHAGEEGKTVAAKAIADILAQEREQAMRTQHHQPDPLRGADAHAGQQSE